MAVQSERKTAKKCLNIRAPYPPCRSRRRPPEVAMYVEQARNLPDVRWEKVSAVREAIAAGEYDVDARLNAILERWRSASDLIETDFTAY